MSFSRIATVLAAAAMLSSPVIASAATRAAPVKFSADAFRAAAKVKRSHGVAAETLLVVLPATAVVAVATVEVAKSNG